MKSKRVYDIALLTFGVSGLMVLSCLGISSCGKVSASGNQVELIMSPMPGYQCFIIRDQDGKTAGANCVK